MSEIMRWNSPQFDSAGIEIGPFDVVEEPGGGSWRWYAASVDPCSGYLEVRDLNANNVATIGCNSDTGRFYTRGPYWFHLDVLSDDDLRYYWQTTRAEAIKKANSRALGE